MTIHASSWNQNILLGFLIRSEIFEKFGQSDAANQSFTSVNFQIYSLVFEGENICQERYLCLGWSFMEEDEVKFINDLLGGYFDMRYGYVDLGSKLTKISKA
jgi:hypothetical protein